MSKYAPGPWEVQPGQAPTNFFIKSNSKHIALVLGEENARLIAMAPRLLEVLEEVVELFQWESSWSPEEEAYDKAMAVIAEAKGESK